jgi:hypothetical protein
MKADLVIVHGRDRALAVRVTTISSPTSAGHTLLSVIYGADSE